MGLYRFACRPMILMTVVPDGKMWINSCDGHSKSWTDACQLIISRILTAKTYITLGPALLIRRTRLLATDFHDQHAKSNFFE